MDGTVVVFVFVFIVYMFVLQEPLNSGDDVSDEEDQELFDTENVVVCQYDKVLLTHTQRRC